ncbi:phosphatidylserine/phosphatidylglycerophosphate/cardiolipin synthase family protein [Pseudomonas sp. MAP12]|uniref:Phosphatidylserine/phosphatidylglycerophosphate/ cardiolipin synthase family protein n=1 Tax=Geopseudomonas aromaticivorans TaxID=2849492 RepID=A0ABS6MZZ5_9GAMM|nr:phosphatidylserine/phosphatidylglycerophosphate/cardiolipin synthase family protein [Pseudomonas aromaticivorans]MBV2134356.1 phosphatidylserine/phosphatidylglycerophosphate/cardiolipin synthase family protein [Pseudomonas aromaticivorans]
MTQAVFPWRAGNRFQLLIDGEQFFPRMIAAIDAAHRQVELELYLVEAGSCANRLVDCLCRAAQRGVEVRCLFDAFGSQRFGARLSGQLRRAGVQLRLYNLIDWRHGVRNLYRDHRKLLLVDQALAWVGGAGATDDFWLPEQAASRWHELMVELAGPAVADWQTLFERQWQACVEAHDWRPYIRPLEHLPPRPLPGAGLGRVAYADSRQHRDILRSLLRTLGHARGRIWLATPYFLPSWRVRKALRKAARRGVDVRLLLSGRLTDHGPVRFAGQRYYPRLLKSGVRIFEYQPRFLHLKAVLVDDWVSIGSCNFDHWTLRFNLEANLEALDPGLTAALASSFESDFAASREITHDDWLARPLGMRLSQRLWGWLDRLVVNLLDRWR